MVKVLAGIAPDAGPQNLYKEFDLTVPKSGNRRGMRMAVADK
jgi:hypothetical protein